MDDGDRAAAYQQRMNEAALARREHKAGPQECRRCAGWNDRAEAGFAVCSACVEEAQ